MSFELIFTPEAEETFDAVITQLQQRWGEKFVDKFEKRVSDCLDTIANTPFIYPVTEENQGIRKCILHKTCSMLYKVDEHKIIIICFWDNRQEPLGIF